MPGMNQRCLDGPVLRSVYGAQSGSTKPEGGREAALARARHFCAAALEMRRAVAKVTLVV